MKEILSTGEFQSIIAYKAEAITISPGIRIDGTSINYTEQKKKGILNLFINDVFFI